MTLPFIVSGVELSVSELEVGTMFMMPVTLSALLCSAVIGNVWVIKVMDIVLCGSSGNDAGNEVHWSIRDFGFVSNLISILVFVFRVVVLFLELMFSNVCIM